MEVIDGYAHCGLSKYEPIERVKDVMSAASVDRAVLVQHLGEFDNAYLARVAAANHDRFAAVCLVDHRSADCIETLSRWVSSRSFKGIRLPSEAIEARPELADAAVDLGLIVVLYARQGISPAARLLARRPEARLVVSHLGHPEPGEAPRFVSSQDMLRLADFPNVYIQLSGMKLSCPWPHEPLYAWIEQVVARFGPRRVYWGSNYPVVGDLADYRDDLALVLEGRLPIAAGDIPAIAGSNAKELWFATADQ